MENRVFLGENWLIELYILLVSNDRLVLMSENFSHLHFYNNMVIKKNSNNFVLGRFYNSMALDPQNKDIVFFAVSQQYGYPKKMTIFLKNYFFFSFTTVWLLTHKTRKLHFFFSFTTV